MTPPSLPLSDSQEYQSLRPSPSPQSVESEVLLQEIFFALDEALNDGQTAFAFFDTALRYRWVNTILAHLHGIPAAEHEGSTVEQVIGTGSAALVLPLLQAALAGKTTRDHPAAGSETDAPEMYRHVSATYFPVRHKSAVAGIALVMRDTTAQRKAEKQQRELAERERSFMRDVLASVTGGRLCLCASSDELPPLLHKRGDSVPITRHGGIRALRLQAEEAATALGFAQEGWFDMETAIGEAAMNALVHAGGGVGTVYAEKIDEQNTAPHGTRLQVRVEDNGSGIAFEHLPRATLEKGYTTSGTLGHGFKMMLRTADRVHLLTGSGGTTVVLEKNRDTPATPSPADEWQSL